ncbi:hypothetical protein ACFSQ7_48175 [Paenibacillus rhizoplanae]
MLPVEARKSKSQKKAAIKKLIIRIVEADLCNGNKSRPNKSHPFYISGRERKPAQAPYYPGLGMYLFEPAQKPSVPDILRSTSSKVASDTSICLPDIPAFTMFFQEYFIQGITLGLFV